jgi:hypothetical protein
MLVELLHGFFEFNPQGGHLEIERSNFFLANQTDPRLRVGECNSLPKAESFAANGRDCFECQMARI